MEGIIAKKIHEASELEKMIVQFHGMLQDAAVNEHGSLEKGLKAALYFYEGFFCKELRLK